MSWEIAVIFALATASFCLIYLSTNMKKHGPMQLLFMFMAVFTLIAQTDVAEKLATINNQSGISDVVVSIYWGYIFMMITLTFYFVLVFIFTHLKMLGKKKPSETGTET